MKQALLVTVLSAVNDLSAQVQQLTQMMRSRESTSSSAAVIPMVSETQKRQLTMSSRRHIMNGGILGTSHGQQTFDCSGRWAASTSSATGALKSVNPVLMNLLLPNASSLGYQPPGGAADVSLT